MSFEPVKGMRDFFPQENSKREQVYDELQRVFEKYCFSKIETPALESLELLEKKSGEEIREQIFWFEDKSSRKLGLRFDLTVPAVRMYLSNPKLPKPVKWFYVSRMWRYEDTRKGRYREFWQASCELIGSDAPASNAEIIALVSDSLENVGLKDVFIRVSNRKILEGVLEDLGVKSPGKKSSILRVLDKLEKIPQKEILLQLEDLGLDEKQTKTLLEASTINGKPESVLKTAREKLPQNALIQQGLSELKATVEELGNLGKNKNVVIDLSVARGLDYYTGLVFEAVSEKNKSIGALAGGGRYDDLIAQLGGQPTPAVGAAIGIERVVELLKNKQKPQTKVFIAYLDEDTRKTAQKLVSELRKKQINCETDLLGRKLSKQLAYADATQTKFLVVIGPREKEQKKANVRNMETGKETPTDFEKIADFVTK